MVLPMIAWTITGVFFFVKPGYQQAYQSLNISYYPLATNLQVAPNNDWQEVRWKRTILGLHLIVKRDNRWTQLNPDTLEEIQMPSVEQVKRLITDAISSDTARYGEIKRIDGSKAITSTDVVINLNWQQLSLSQQGTDTNFINQMYKIHYLQWTGIESIDRFLGIIGLATVLMLALIGLKMAFRRPKLSNR